MTPRLRDLFANTVIPGPRSWYAPGADSRERFTTSSGFAQVPGVDGTVPAAEIAGRSRVVLSDLLDIIVAAVTWPFRAVGRLLGAIFG
jgi:hypothetical protein